MFLCPFGFPELDQYLIENAGQCGNKMAARLGRRLDEGSRAVVEPVRGGGGRSLNPLQTSPDQYRESKMAGSQGGCPGISAVWFAGWGTEGNAAASPNFLLSIFIEAY